MIKARHIKPFSANIDKKSRKTDPTIKILGLASAAAAAGSGVGAQPPIHLQNRRKFRSGRNATDEVPPYAKRSLGVNWP